MSQRAALLVSVALTAFILLTGVELAARIQRGDPTAVDNGDSTTATAAADVDPDQDLVYRDVFDRLQEANAALASSYDRISGLLDRVDQLQTQNSELRERERVYQQRLAEANSRLESQGQTAIAIPLSSQAPSAGVAPRAGQQGEHERD
jgi:hypothetical protein